MAKNDLILDLLKFIYVTQYPSKKLMRSIVGSYDYTGRVIKQLINKGYILETKINDITVVCLTKEGLNYLKPYIDFDDVLYKRMKLRVKGEKNKFRQAKLAQTIQMLNKYVPTYIDNYLLFEKNNSNSFDNKSRRSKIEKIRNEIFQREQRSLSAKQGCWFITFREMRELDVNNLKNIPSTRVQGIFHIGGKDFAVYNHYKKRMKMYGNFEYVFNQFAEEVCDKPLNGAIHFGSSFQILLDTITKTPPMQKNSYIISNLIYPTQYFVPLTSDGINQLSIYSIKNFNKHLGNALLSEEQISNAKNLIVDGYEDNLLTYLGFECNYNSIESLYQCMQTVYLKNDLEIYCFPHQAYFYEQLFKNHSVKIKTIPIEKVLNFLKRKGNDNK